MKVLFIISLWISTALCAYLDNLNRTFAESDFKTVDLYIQMPTTEVEKLIEMSQIVVSQVSGYKGDSIPDFEYSEATLTIKMDGNEEIFEKVKFKTGGMYGRSHNKIGYNIKLNKKFLGRKQFKIRAEAYDRSYIRQKLSCDIANRIGLPSIQSTFVRLYINDQYWGLYTMMDAIKPSWIKQTFKPTAEEITDLFQCKVGIMDLTKGSDALCKNANDDYPDLSEFTEFVNQVSDATTSEELEQIMDVDVFIKALAFEYLIGSFDQFLVNGVNFFFYRRESDNKWVYIAYDYDNTFGNGIYKPTYWINHGIYSNVTNDEVVNMTFKQWELDKPIIKTLIHDHPERFSKSIREVLVSGFNPVILETHIDQIKEFLYPLVEEDTTKDEDGNLPGRINKVGNQLGYNTYQFETNIESELWGSQGVKPWINGKFEAACKEFNFDQEEIISEALNYIPKSYDYSASSANNEQTEIDNAITDDCWSEALGYKCCSKCNVILTDKNGKWGIENNKWCGIKENVCELSTSKCYGEETGEYPCCSHCNTFLVTLSGRWGIEKRKWCSINYSC